MVRTKTCPSGPHSNSPPPSPPVTSKAFEPLDEETLLKSIPESVVTFKAGPPPKKPRTAAVVAAAAIAEEIEEEKNKDPWKGCGFRKHGKQFNPGFCDTPTGPFIKGQIGKVLISDKPCQSLESMASGYSLIVASWRKVLPGRGGVSNQYEITDPYGNLWWAPPVFGMWREAVEGGTLPELNMEET